MKTVRGKFVAVGRLRHREIPRHIYHVNAVFPGNAPYLLSVCRKRLPCYFLAAAFAVRKTTYDSFKNLSETPPEITPAQENAVSEKDNEAEKSTESEEVSDFYDKD